MGQVIFGADSRLDQDTLTVSVAADANFPTTNLNDDRAFTKYKMGAAATELLVKTDVGTIAGVDYFMLVGHDLSDPDSDGNGGVLAEFQHSADDISYTTIFSVTPTDDKIIARFFTAEINRFFRLRLTRGAAFKASLGELQWGFSNQLQSQSSIPIGVTVGFDPNDEVVEGQFGQPASGNLLNPIRVFSSRRALVSFPFLGGLINDADNVQGFKFFWDTHASKLKPFLFHWNPGAVGAAGSFEKDAFFGVIDPDAGISRPVPTLDGSFLATRNLEFTVVGLKE